MFYSNMFLKELKKIWENFNLNSLPLVLGINTQFPKYVTEGLIPQFSFKVIHSFVLLIKYIYIYRCIPGPYRHLFKTGNEQDKTVKI